MQEKLIIKNASLCPESNSAPITLKKFFVFGISTVLFSFFSITFTNADGGVSTVYGGGQYGVGGGPGQGAISVQKTVQNPVSGAFVKNLGSNDPIFTPAQTVTFQITVTNTSTTTVKNITVVDTLPKLLDFQSGHGSFDQKSKNLTFSINTLNPNESKVFILLAKVSQAGSFSNNNVNCVSNQVSAASPNVLTAFASSQVCLQKSAVTKGGLPVAPAPSIATTPPTGPEIIPLLALFPTGILGYFLRKNKPKIRF